MDDSQIREYLMREKMRESEALRLFQDEGSRLTVEEMRGIVPLKTGFLRESITSSPTPSGFTVYPTARYAGFVDKGTSPHTIFPSGARALRFETAWGGVIFAKHVQHPGTRPTFFIQRTADAVIPKLAEQLRSILERVYS
jgi:hypothetical protein